jgi:hypothetical protein
MIVRGPILSTMLYTRYARLFLLSLVDMATKKRLLIYFLVASIGIAVREQCSCVLGWMQIGRKGTWAYTRFILCCYDRGRKEGGPPNWGRRVFRMFHL